MSLFQTFAAVWLCGLVGTLYASEIDVSGDVPQTSGHFEGKMTKFLEHAQDAANALSVSSRRLLNYLNVPSHNPPGVALLALVLGIPTIYLLFVFFVGQQLRSLS